MSTTSRPSRPPSALPTDPDVLGRRLPRSVREFLDTESASGVLLIVATVIAIAWVNSPWSSSYDALWATVIDLHLGASSFTTDIGHLLSEGLLSLFFFMVGLEIKRELVHGDLRHWRTASLPVICALGGVLLPGAIYLAVNHGAAGERGWGIPMATDIAFAVGVLTLLGRRVPPSLKLFLLTLAVVDDLVAIIVIGVFYADGFSFLPLAVAGGLLALIAGLRAARVHWAPVYVLAGVLVWFAIHASGASATITGVVLALFVPVRPRIASEVLDEWQVDLAEDLTPEDVRLLHRYASTAVSTADRAIHALHPTVSFVIIPLFALANAGVALSVSSVSSADGSRVALGLLLAKVLGKLVGIVAAAALAVRLRIAHLPRDATWPQFVGVAAIGGIGFTVSLLITSIAFTDVALIASAKLAILVASLVAAGLGSAVLIVSARQPA